MKLESFAPMAPTGPRNTQTLSDADWEEGLDQLELLKDIANNRSKVKYEIVRSTLFTTPSFDLITVGDVQGYPSLNFNRAVTGPVGERKKHYHVYCELGPNFERVSEFMESEPEARRRFLELLKEAP